MIRDRRRARFPENPEHTRLHQSVCVSVLWFFPDIARGDGPEKFSAKIGIYFCSARHISPRIGIPWYQHMRLDFIIQFHTLNQSR